MSALFQPFSLKSVTLRNRIAVPPMCQYMAENGQVGDWHRLHYPALARGGAGLVIVEATGVQPEGRITPGCLGIWSDELAAGFAPIVKAIKGFGAVPGIQIAHAGRKASAALPWQGGAQYAAEDSQGWQTVAPSAVAFGGHLKQEPHELAHAEIAQIQADFVTAAKRAYAVGFEWLELHFAHGYLAQSFYSKRANFRTDDYGGSLENRSRFIRETFAAVRAVWPEHLPLTMRFGVTEFTGEVEEDLAEAVILSRQLKDDGLDLLSVSMGFSAPGGATPWGPGFMGPIAQHMRRETGMPVASSWGFGEPQIAEKAIADAQMDVVMIGKAHLANPHWSFEAARALKLEQAAAQTLPPSYAHSLGRY